jgi:excisionase family DNA binding protein
MPIHLTDECLMTAAEVAVRLAISKKTLLRHVREGEIACVTIGTGLRTHRRFALSHVAEFISNRGKADSDMSVYKSKASHFTTTTSRSKAIAFTELPKARTKGTRKPWRQRRQRKYDVWQLHRTGTTPLTINAAVGRYWTKKAQYRNWFRSLRVLSCILVRTSARTRLTTKRSPRWWSTNVNQFRWRKPKLKHSDVKTLSNASINRHALISLKASFRRAIAFADGACSIEPDNIRPSVALWENAYACPEAAFSRRCRSHRRGLGLPQRRATIATLLADCAHLRELVVIATGCISKELTRGWTHELQRQD